jgi:hypothetical protein
MSVFPVSFDGLYLMPTVVQMRCALLRAKYNNDDIFSEEFLWCQMMWTLYDYSCFLILDFDNLDGIVLEIANVKSILLNCAIDRIVVKYMEIQDNTMKKIKSISALYCAFPRIENFILLHSICTGYETSVDLVEKNNDELMNKLCAQDMSTVSYPCMASMHLQVIALGKSSLNLFCQNCEISDGFEDVISQLQK